MVLGKRKERDEESDSSHDHGSTLFVSNIPYTATSVDLQTLFSDIAPVRSAFVVTEHGTGVSKGVGYVSFSIREDAEAAHEKSLKDGIILARRKLRVEWADRKSKHTVKEGGEVKSASKPSGPRPTVQKGPYDPAAIRTILVSGLPRNLDSKQLWKKIRKCEGAEKLDWPHKAEDGTEDHTLAHVPFSTPSAANNAVNKLHAHVFKGSILSVTLKKRFDNLAKPVTVSNAEPGTAPVLAPSPASRLIVRNLPFSITEQDLRALFLPYGPIYQIHIPTTQVTLEGGGSKERARGFAFVWMLSKQDAERAIQGCNAKLVRTGTAEAMISDKQKKKKQKRLEKKLREAGKVKEEEVAERQDGKVDDEDEEEEASKITERAIAVDWALSKEKWEGEKAKLESQADEDIDMDSISGGEEEEEVESAAEQKKDYGLHSVYDEDKEDHATSRDDEDEDGDDGEEPVKPSLPPTDVGTTVFVRNIPFTATEDELRTLFRAFGPLRYARITMDPESGRSRGTGFACFWNKEDADRVIDQSDLLRAETTGNAPVPAKKKNPFVLPSILTPDPSSSLAQSLVLHGRTLDAVRAVTREEASKLEEEGEKARQKADKRNMYLLKEGVILPNSPLAQDLAPADLERRTSSFNARRALLKSNPSLFISRTRLSVRQIPMFVTERVLKRLALHASRAFEAEVKQGSRNGLSPDECADPPAEEGEGASRASKPGVKQAKIVRQQDRVDPVTGKGRSKGYGFVEMHKHSDALRILRWANGNPEVGPLFQKWYKEELEDLLKTEKSKDQSKRNDTKIRKLQEELDNGSIKKGKVALIVEFSIENVQVLQRRSAIQHTPTRINSKIPAEHEEDNTAKMSSISEKEESLLQKKRRKISTREASVESKKEDKKSKISSIITRKQREKRKGKKSR